MASRHPARLEPPESPETPSVSTETTDQRTRTVSPERMLDLLGDEYTRRVLEALVEDPRTGSEVVDAADVSKATAYRRLEELQEAGLVETTLRIDADGHHCKEFHAVVERVAVEFGEDGCDASAQVHLDDPTAGGDGSPIDGYAGAGD